jgi:multidrug transporter EmrE-like cation transporter
MNTTFLLGAALGMLGALSINIGKGVQKLKVQVFRQGRAMLKPPHRRDLGIWIVGMLITATSAVPISLGMKLTESPSTIGAMTGVGLIGLVIFASRVVKEPMSRRDFAGIALVVVGTSVLGYLGGLNKPTGRHFETWHMARSVAFPFVFGIAGCIAARFWTRLHAVAWGTMAGIFLGSSFFLADAALVKSGGDFFGQLRNPYPYVAFGIGVGAMVATQIGFLKGRALEVVPAVNSATIIIPVILEILLYARYPRPMAGVMIATIVTGVYLLSTGTAVKVSSGPTP